MTLPFGFIFCHAIIKMKGNSYFPILELWKQHQIYFVIFHKQKESPMTTDDKDMCQNLLIKIVFIIAPKISLEKLDAEIGRN